MVDVTFEQIKDFFSHLDPSAALNFFEKLRASSETMASVMDKVHVSATGMKDAVIKAAEAAEKDFAAVIDKVNGGLSDLKDSLGMTTDEVEKIGIELIVVAGVLKSGLQPDVFLKLSSYAQDTTTNLKHVETGITGIGKALGSIPGVGKELQGIVNVIQPIIGLANSAKAAEAGLLGMASASGDLNSFLEDVGENFSGLEKYTVNYTKMLGATAEATGQTISQVGEYANVLGMIPGALKTTIDLTADGKEKMNMLDVSMKLASGTGQSFKAVFDEMNMVYRKFGTTGKEAAEYVSRLSEASKALKMPLELVKDYTQNAANSFKFLGDNSQASISILGKFGSALKDSIGVGPEAIADLSKGVTDNISKMSIAQNAFLSQTSGGVGGLQGSFQIDLLKKQGKVDEVQKMMEQSLKKQFGGNITTLDEGTKSQSAAKQLTKEVMLLTTGPTKMANTKEEAYLILEAMKKGTTAKPIDIKSPEKSLEETVKIGTNFQKTQNDLTTKLVSFAEKQTLFAAITANAEMKKLTGADSPYAAKFLSDSMTKGTDKAANIAYFGPDAKKSSGKKELTEELPKEVSETMAKIRNTMAAGRASESEKKKFLQQAHQEQEPKKQSLPGMNDAMQSQTKAGSFLNKLKGMYGGASDVPETSEIGLPSGLKTSRNRVAQDIGVPKEQQPGSSNNKNVSGKNNQTIDIGVICPECNKKDAKKIAIEVVDGKIEELIKHQITQAQGINLG